MSPTVTNPSTNNGRFPSVVVTSLAATTSIAGDVDATWKGLLNGESGIGVLEDDFVSEYGLPVRKLCTVAGDLQGGDFRFRKVAGAIAPVAAAVLAVLAKYFVKELSRNLVVLLVGKIRNKSDWRRSHHGCELIRQHRSLLDIVGLNLFTLATQQTTYAFAYDCIRNQT